MTMDKIEFCMGSGKFFCKLQISDWWWRGNYFYDTRENTDNVLLLKVLYDYTRVQTSNNVATTLEISSTTK